MRATARWRPALLVVLGAVAASVLPAVAAQAAAPANDRIGNATRISSLPFRSVTDTSEATRSPSDGECVEGASIWYRFRPSFTGPVRVATIGSDHDTLLAVFRGSRTSRTLRACADDFADLTSVLSVDVRAGRTYWVAVSTFDSTGGPTVLNLYRPRAARATTTVASVETGAVSGRAYVDGSIRCRTPSLAAVEVSVSQRVGAGAVAQGTGFLELDCGARRPTARWAAGIDSATGWAFQPGTASVTVISESYDGFQFTFREQTANMTVGSNPDRAGPRSTPDRPDRLSWPGAV
jgi:hypothetical protein